jgi:signal transduction histidine kinase
VTKNNHNRKTESPTSVTKQKQTNPLLDEPESWCRSLLDSVNIGIAIITPDMKILSANKQMKGWFPSQNYSKKPKCYRILNEKPRTKPCPNCPTIETLKDSKTHETTTTTQTGNKTTTYRIVSIPVKNNHQKPHLIIETFNNITAANHHKKHEELLKQRNQQTALMKSITQIIHSTDLHQRLQAILNAIHQLGWRRVVLSVRDENLNIQKPEDIVTAGLTKKEKQYLWNNTRSGETWKTRFGPKFEHYKMGQFYYLPWSDPFVRKQFSQGTVQSHLKQEEMIDWNPDDLLYAPLRLADGRIVAVVSVDDPVDGRRPTPESLAPLELFLYQAAVAIENARLIKQLNDAKTQMQEYAGQLEIKVKERTRELVDTQYRLLKSERLAAIGELAGMVGHDLRNPLTGIAGAAYYLRTRLSSKISKKARDMLKLIEEDIGHSNKIINDLLEYSKEIRLDLTDTNPKTLLKETLASIKIPKRIHVTDRTQTSPRIRVDAQRMRRVFTNIIRNAFDAMPDNGTVTIRSKKTADGVVFSFSDTGAGMSRETVEKLWTPLFTTKAKGMGFGLPICKRVVEGHGGNISASSEPGKGSTFTIALPIEPKTQEESCRVFMVPLEPSPRVIDGAKTLE